MKIITFRSTGSKNTEAQKERDDRRARLSNMVKNSNDKRKTKVTLPTLTFMKEGIDKCSGSDS